MKRVMETRGFASLHRQSSFCFSHSVIIWRGVQPFAKAGVFIKSSSCFFMRPPSVFAVDFARQKRQRLRPMKNMHDLSKAMNILAANYDLFNGKGSFKQLDDESLETLCDAVGAHVEGNPSVSGWREACHSFCLTR